MGGSLAGGDTKHVWQGDERKGTEKWGGEDVVIEFAI